MRQRRPDLPNFRDHGLMVDRPLLRLLANLQRAHGYGWASQASLRSMIHQDTGHCPGVGTLPKALRRLEAIGYCEVRWIHRGSPTPDGGTAEVGMLRLRVAHNRGERRAIASRAGKVDHRQSAGGRVVRQVPATYAAARREIARGAPQAESRAQRDLDLRGVAHIDEAARAAQNAAARQWMLEYGNDGQQRERQREPGEPRPAFETQPR